MKRAVFFRQDAIVSEMEDETSSKGNLSRSAGDGPEMEAVCLDRKTFTVKTHEGFSLQSFCMAGFLSGHCWKDDRVLVR